MCVNIFFFCFKQKTAYEMRISDWSSDVCSSDLGGLVAIVGTLAVLIPPSNVIVLYGLLTGTPIGPLLIAGIIPGLIASCALIVCLQLMIWRNPALAPSSKINVALGEKIRLLKGVGPIIVLFMKIGRAHV